MGMLLNSTRQECIIEELAIGQPYRVLMGEYQPEEQEAVFFGTRWRDELVAYVATPKYSPKQQCRMAYAADAEVGQLISVPRHYSDRKCRVQAVGDGDSISVATLNGEGFNLPRETRIMILAKSRFSDITEAYNEHLASCLRESFRVSPITN